MLNDVRRAGRVPSAGRGQVEDMYMSARAVGVEAPDGVRLGRYLPLSIGVTASADGVVVLASFEG